MNVITFRKGNPISHDRTLRFLLVCKVIGSPSRSRFASREFNILQVRVEHYLGRDTIPQLQDTGIPLPATVGYLLIEYLRIDSVIESLSLRRGRSLASTFTPARRGATKTAEREQANDLETAGAYTHREILVPMAKHLRNVREDKSRLYRRSLITLALRWEISFR